MRVLIYKQTHIGDPDQYGCWGQTDCMGRIRNIQYDAVISAGGISAWPEKEGIAGKVTWLGLAPTKFKQHDFRGAIIQFQKFTRFETNGPQLSLEAPTLARHLFEGRSRYFIAKGKELEEAKALIEKYLNSQSNCMPSKKLPNRIHKPHSGLCSRSMTRCVKCQLKP